LGGDSFPNVSFGPDRARLLDLVFESLMQARLGVNLRQVLSRLTYLLLLWASFALVKPH
jgi:hypothetical protein